MINHDTIALFVGLCLRSFEKVCSGGEPVVTFNYGRPQIDNKWYDITLIKVFFRASPQLLSSLNS